MGTSHPPPWEFLAYPIEALLFPMGILGLPSSITHSNRYTCAGIELYAQRISTNSYLAISKAWRAVLMM